MELVSSNRMFAGEQRVYRHDSDECQCAMQFGIYLPDAALADEPGKMQTLFWLSGLTCTEQNFVTKAGAQRLASELGVIVVAPDTSPRGDDVADDPEGSYDFGLGAGFYVDATQQPYARHYRMHSYVASELYDLVVASFPVDPRRVGVFGHSMGGHGALTLHFNYPEKFKTCSAFAPIVAPSRVPWGQKAFAGYLGDDRVDWARYDACELVAGGASGTQLLIDQGSSDDFLEEQLKPELFRDACTVAGQKLTLNLRAGYDHSYYFIASFMEAHFQHHLSGLNAP